MGDDLRLRVKLAENEFEAQGSREDVIARFDAWKELLTASKAAPTPPVIPPNPGTPAGTAPAAPAGALGIPEATAALALQLGLDPALITGAIAPSATKPFLHLDQHCWEAIKKNTPTAGPGSVSPSAMAATLLVLWWEHVFPTTKPKLTNVADVLATISLTDRNAGRAIKNCEWLQYRDGHVLPNPAERSKAVAVAKAFCSKQEVAKLAKADD